MVPNFLIDQDKKYITRKLNVLVSFSKYLQNDMLPVMNHISAFVFQTCLVRQKLWVSLEDKRFGHATRFLKKNHKNLKFSLLWSKVF